MSDIVPQKTEMDLAATISRAVELGTPVETIERLWVMKKEMMKMEAEQAFNAALARVQGKMERIAADLNNPQTKSRYASYAALDRVLRPIYSDEGFAISYDTGETTQENAVRVLAYVSHRDGHMRTYHADMDASGKGAKGGDVMTKTHAAGSAMSYGMRYLLKLIFNVAIGEDDDDGNAASIPRISESQVADLRALIEEVGADESAFLKYMGADKLADIQAKAYKDAVAALEKKRKRA